MEAMVTTIDITFCGELLRKAGEHLFEVSKQAKRSTSVEELFGQFHEHNQWVENSIKTALFARYPHIQWSDAEFMLDKQKAAEFEDEYWICDPIDGAVHFLQGFAFFSISLCLIRNGQPVLSFIYDPWNQELFQAVAGKGAYLNGKPIQVSQKQNLSDAVLATSPPTDPSEDQKNTELLLKGISGLMPKAFAIRMLGSVSLQLAYVACGRLDGFFEFGDGPYDWLAGALLIQEAGGVVSDHRGDTFTWGTSGIIAAYPSIHQQMKNEIQMS